MVGSEMELTTKTRPLKRPIHRRKIMATPKKKHLIELMIEASVKWPDGAEYAAQDKCDNKAHFYKSGKPKLYSGWLNWMADECEFLGNEYSILLPSLCRNWHQTIVTREQYAEALAAATQYVQHEAREIEDIPVVSAVEWPNTPSIEQLTADYHAKAAEADRLQAVADEALKASDDALITLEKAGELLGLNISIISTQKQQAQPEITDWRDLRVGDFVEYVDGAREKSKGKAGKVTELDDSDFSVTHVRIVFDDGTYGWPTKWRFIRRP